MRAERVGCEIKRNGPLPEARRGFRDFRHLPGLGVPSGSFARDLGGNRIDFGSNARCGFAARKRDAVAESAALENSAFVRGAPGLVDGVSGKFGRPIGKFCAAVPDGRFLSRDKSGQGRLHDGVHAGDRAGRANPRCRISSVHRVGDSGETSNGAAMASSRREPGSDCGRSRDGGRCDSSAGGGFPTENCFSK